MFTCLALRKSFGVGDDLNFPAFESQDKKCLEGEQPDELQDPPFSVEALEYDLIACAKLHFDIKDGWQSALIAIALQRWHRLEDFKFDEQKAYYSMKYNQKPPRKVLADDVEKEYGAMIFDFEQNSVYTYWKEYNTATKKSSAKHPLSSPPTLEAIEARFKAALYNWDHPDTFMWTCTDGEELLIGKPEPK
ncbi:MAG: hypothetical protein L6R38_001160 [Xanthoria sp. 2 TBL-2021]|nr:MAG: hypothetical protein L6R38_001160 [Xanthoria sp. 2 TBL-2021]